MANYYMLGGDGKEYGPISAEQLRHWAAEGRANNYTQVRAEDDGPWVTFGAVMELSAPTTTYAASAVHPNLLPLAAKIGSVNQGSSDEIIKRLASIITSAGGWIKLLAVAMILSAVIGTLGTFGIGIIIAWIPLWLGVLLWTSVNRANRALLSGVERDLQDCLDRLRFYFKLNGILILLYLIALIALAIIVAAVPSLLPAGSLPGLR